MLEAGPSEARGRILLAVAAEHLAHVLAGMPEQARDEAWLQEQGAVFVTLRKEGALRGCVGTLQASRPLIEDVRYNTSGAALRDPRFPPVVAAELPEIELEISLLSAPEPVACSSEAEAMAGLRPGRDGVVIAYGRHRATFLPQVWESLPDPPQLFARLKRKAGLPTDFWHPDVEVWRYTVRKWSQADMASS